MGVICWVGWERIRESRGCPEGKKGGRGQVWVWGPRRGALSHLARAPVQQNRDTPPPSSGVSEALAAGEICPRGVYLSLLVLGELVCL